MLSACPSLKPDTCLDIAINCSWYKIVPYVSFKILSIPFNGNLIFSIPFFTLAYSLSIPTLIGPGLAIALIATISLNSVGFISSIIFFMRLDSIWNIASVFLSDIYSYSCESVISTQSYKFSIDSSSLMSFNVSWIILIVLSPRISYFIKLYSSNWGPVYNVIVTPVFLSNLVGT